MRRKEGEREAERGDEGRGEEGGEGEMSHQPRYM